MSNPWRKVTETEPPAEEDILILPEGHDRSREGYLHGNRQYWIPGGDPVRRQLGDLWMPLPARDSLSATEPAGDAGLRALCDEIVTLTTMFRGQPDEHTCLPIEGHRAQKLYQKLDALRAAMKPATETP